MRDQARCHTAAAITYQDKLRSVVQLLRRMGVEPIVVKGWTVARLYPETGLRPCGDIDLAVAPEQIEVAARELAAAGESSVEVDLHAGVADLEDRRWDDVLRRSRLVDLDGVGIRVLSAEDQLRQLCLHLMRHGAYRPLWLCDVAVALESLPPDFDWDYCLSGSRALTDWVRCTLWLAGELLGARLDAPAACGAERLAPWIKLSVLRTWGAGRAGSDSVERAWRDYSLGELGQALRERWPNPIRAAYKLRLSPFTRMPRFISQLAAFSLRMLQFAGSKFPAPRSRPASFEIHPATIR
jgi:hypothetical protein